MQSRRMLTVFVQLDVAEVLNVLSSYNTASGDCGILLASKFSTETKRVISTKVIKQPSTLSFTTITSTPKNQVTETGRLSRVQATILILTCPHSI